MRETEDGWMDICYKTFLAIMQLSWIKDYHYYCCYLSLLLSIINVASGDINHCQGIFLSTLGQNQMSIPVQLEVAAYHAYFVDSADVQFLNSFWVTRKYSLLALRFIIWNTMVFCCQLVNIAFNEAMTENVFLKEIKCALRFNKLNFRFIIHLTLDVPVVLFQSYII